MRVLALKAFARFQRREGISDAMLCAVVKRADDGLIDADLGSGLIKQRVARRGQGRRGGFRVLLAYRAGHRVVFLYGFAKNSRENIDPDELADWRTVGALWLQANDEEVEAGVADDRLKEIHCDDD